LFKYTDFAKREYRYLRKNIFEIIPKSTTNREGSNSYTNYLEFNYYSNLFMWVVVVLKPHRGIEYELFPMKRNSLENDYYDITGLGTFN